MKSASPFRVAVITLLWAWAALFVLAPALLLIFTSVLERSEHSLLAFHFTAENYQRLGDPVYLNIALQSLHMAGLATLACLVVGYPFAYALSRQPASVKPLLLVLLMVPFWTNSLVRTFALKMMLASRGVINTTLLKLGLIDRPLNLLYDEAAVIIGLIYVMLPFMVLPLYAVFEELRQDLREASQDLGANTLRTFFHITLPLTLPGIIAGCLLVFLPSLGSFFVVDVLGGARVLLVGNAIKNQFLEARDWPFGAAMSVGLSVVMAVLLIAYHATRKHTQVRALEAV